MLEGRRLLLTGVLNRDSIAFATARRAQELGAEVILTGFGRTKRMTERSAGQLPQRAEVLELDVNDPEGLERIGAQLAERWGALDGLLHAVAYAPPDALGDGFLDTPLQSAVVAYETSAFSLKALTVALLGLLEAAPDGAGVVGLDFDASVAWPSYNWMGVAKAALEAVARYLARDLGERGIRVNLVSAGPIETLAAGGIPGFSELAALWSATAPLPWDTQDPGPVADAACFLMSPMARGITAEIVHVDGGYHAIGCPSPRTALTLGGPLLQRRGDVSGAVLLTGATGFLGMDLLARLIEREEREIVVLVRAADREGAQARVAAVLERLYDEPPPAAGAVRAVRGDLLQPQLGLTEEDRASLVETVDRIVHCAASISFDLPLVQAREINVGGLERVIELAREIAAAGELRRFVHVSTAYVSGCHVGPFGEEDLALGQAFRNTYEHSKQEGELLLNEARDLPAVIARPSIVVGDSTSGWTATFNVIYWMIRAFERGLIEEVPARPDSIVDFVPIDYVTDGVLALLDRADASGTYNLVAGAQALLAGNLVELHSSLLDRPPVRFTARENGTLPEGAETYVPYFDVRCSFTDVRAQALFEEEGVVKPDPHDYFSQLLSYAHLTRWGKKVGLAAGFAGERRHPLTNAY